MNSASPKSPLVFAALLVLASACVLPAQQAAYPGRAYLGFDRNNYPGDAALPALRRTFSYTSYWLNAPPGETANTWSGKRTLLKKYGFGFLILFNGRLDKQILAAQQQGQSPASLGTTDGYAAARSALHEGFRSPIVIFLDQEEGGRLLPEQSAYLFAWIATVRAAGFRAGVYCSGIALPGSISTAEDIAARINAQAPPPKNQSAEHPPLAIWIANDQCPPAPGCSLMPPPISAVSTPQTAPFLRVWQYAQSPRRQFAAACPAYPSGNANCYAPGTSIFIDLDTATTPDPSETP